jgi:hypothetical protein
LQSCNNREGNTDCSFPGCKLPDDNPELFAPGFITGHYQTRDIAINPEGTELYFGAHIAGHYTILITKKTDSGWSEPEIVEHLDDLSYMNIEPALSYDGDKLFFLSNRPGTDGENDADQDIWVMERTDKGWSKPYNLGEPVNSESAEFFPSLTRDGTLYFTRSDPASLQSYIYRSRYIDGKYQEPEKLPEQVNCGVNQYNAFIAYDESYIIVPANGREDSFGGTDYYIVFRSEDDNWSNPVNMGKKINTTDSNEFSAYVTRDNKYIFFMSRRFREAPEKITWKYLKEISAKPESGNPSIYWMKADIIDSLRNVAVFDTAQEGI